MTDETANDKRIKMVTQKYYRISEQDK